MYVNETDILKAEHKLLTEALDGVENKTDYMTGYVMGVVNLAEELSKEKKEGS